MPYCVVYGCNSNPQCDKNIYWFTFPKDSQRNRAWVHYCKRQDFTPSKRSRICSKHFTLHQYSRHPERLLELGYPGAKAALKDDAVPDIPVLEQAFNDTLDKSLDSIDIETESSSAHDRKSKKLETRAKKKDTGGIRPWIKSIVNHTYWVAASSGEDQNVKIHKWTSISNHIINKHVHESDVFPQCIHGELEEQRAWLKQGSRSHKLVLEVMESKYLLNDLKKLSPVHQIYIAALHYIENGNRQQAVTKAGILKWKKSYPKAKKGEQCVVKPQKVQATYDYVGALLKRTFDRRNNLSSIKEALEDFNFVDRDFLH
ncbi:unnamed protein product [Mytilus coruscus]|uniref:THAP-type domain-containing protein n=1 Tax=Mytilus coruscus TaxID=42192 RepID=A0A6J8BI93_MYTCO|nr:unnamed protein product [Mytilus coruscus]